MASFSGQLQVIRFANHYQAFWYAVGKFGIAGISFPIVLILGWIYLTRLNQYREITRLTAQYPAFQQYTQLMKAGQTVTTTQGTFLVLKLANSHQMKVGESYIHHKKDNHIYVPIKLNE
jgi:hypothetical protein